MQKLMILFAGFLLAGNLAAQSANDQLIGLWTNEDQTHTIEFVQNGDTYEALIRKADEANLVGKKQITGLEKVGKDAFDKGTLYIIRKGRTAKCSVKMPDRDRLKLTASVGLFSKSQTFFRVEQ